jgi:hypothetical protein
VLLKKISARSGDGAYWLSRPEQIPLVVDATKVRIVPAAQLASLELHAGRYRRRGDHSGFLLIGAKFRGFTLSILRLWQDCSLVVLLRRPRVLQC